MDKNEIKAYLGCAGKEFSESENQLLDECISCITKLVRPGLVYKFMDIADSPDFEVLLEGNDIKKFLTGCSKMVVMAATVGYDVDKIISRMQVEDMSKAVILDACASTAIENICNNFESDLRNELAAQSLQLTGRYSPGYGDYPIHKQKNIGEYLNTSRQIGMIIADNYLMTPIKSVTAVMGISAGTVTQKKHKCEECSKYETCSFRRNNK